MLRIDIHPLFAVLAIQNVRQNTKILDLEEFWFPSRL
jgi:hypothetical protein